MFSLTPLSRSSGVRRRAESMSVTSTPYSFARWTALFLFRFRRPRKRSPYLLIASARLAP